jgi:hypothetical protein
VKQTALGISRQLVFSGDGASPADVHADNHDAA